MVLVAAVHLLYAPGYAAIVAYLGGLFYATAVGALVVTVVLLWDARLWAWVLGITIAGAASAGYVVTRTVGLPKFPIQPWGDPFGLASLLLEVLFLILASTVVRGQPLANGSHSRMRPKLRKPSAA
jgi:hypothetical protein